MVAVLSKFQKSEYNKIKRRMRSVAIASMCILAGAIDIGKKSIFEEPSMMDKESLSQTNTN